MVVMKLYSNLHSIASCRFHRPTIPLFPFSLIWYLEFFFFYLYKVFLMF